MPDDAEIEIIKDKFQVEERSDTQLISGASQDTWNNLDDVSENSIYSA